MKCFLMFSLFSSDLKFGRLKATNDEGKRQSPLTGDGSFLPSLGDTKKIVADFHTSTIVSKETRKVKQGPFAYSVNLSTGRLYLQVLQKWQILNMFYYCIHCSYNMKIVNHCIDASQPAMLCTLHGEYCQRVLSVCQLECLSRERRWLPTRVKKLI